MRELPPVLSGDALQQIAALRDYLVRTARGSESETVETVAAHAGGIWKQAGRATGAAALPGGENQSPDALQREARLRALIVKSAEESRKRDHVLQESIGDLGCEMRQSYLARSEFGEYQQEILLLIDATARQIVESYDFTARLSAADERLGELAGALTRLRGEIRRGLIQDPETGELCFGIAIAQELRFTGQTVTENGLVYEELAPGQTLGLYTASGWQFWINGSKRGWFDASDGQLHIRSLTAEQELRLGGDWLCTSSGGFGIRYVGI